MTLLDDLKTIRIFFIKKAAEEPLQAAFVIDGRDYSDPAAVRRDTLAAFQALEARWIVAESELRPVQTDTPSLGLPAWSEFKSTLPRQSDNDGRE